MNKLDKRPLIFVKKIKKNLNLKEWNSLEKLTPDKKIAVRVHSRVHKK